MTAAKACAVAVAVVFVGLPVAGDGGSKEPDAVFCAFWEGAGAALRVGVAVGGWGGLQAEGGAAYGVQELALGGEFGEHEDFIAGLVDGFQQEAGPGCGIGGDGDGGVPAEPVLRDDGLGVFCHLVGESGLVELKGFAAEGGGGVVAGAGCVVVFARGFNGGVFGAQEGVEG